MLEINDKLLILGLMKLEWKLLVFLPVHFKINTRSGFKNTKKIKPKNNEFADFHFYPHYCL